MIRRLLKTSVVNSAATSSMLVRPLVLLQRAEIRHRQRQRSQPLAAQQLERVRHLLDRQRRLQKQAAHHRRVAQLLVGRVQQPPLMQQFVRQFVVSAANQQDLQQAARGGAPRRSSISSSERLRPIQRSSGIVGSAERGLRRLHQRRNRRAADQYRAARSAAPLRPAGSPAAAATRRRIPRRPAPANRARALLCPPSAATNCARAWAASCASSG